jgi:hypothetical protein
MREFRGPLPGPDYLTVVGGMIDAMVSDKTPPADREAIRTAMLAAPKHVLVSAAEGTGEPGRQASTGVSTRLSRSVAC